MTTHPDPGEILVMELDQGVADDSTTEKQRLPLEIRVTAASVPGTDHILPGKPTWRNNQDAYALVTRSHGPTIAVVCDGCGSGDHSEIGAWLGAKQLAQILDRELAFCTTPSQLDWDAIRHELMNELTMSARAMGNDLQTTVEHFFLFTIIGFIITQEETQVFILGDGMYAINSEIHEVGPYKDNAPPYLMYGVTGSPILDQDPTLASFRTRVFQTEDIRTIGVGTDGVMDLVAAEASHFPGTSEAIGPFQLLFGEAFFDNPDRLRRHLARANRETVKDGRIKCGVLPDDTTLILARIQRD